jgi:putative DNA primase/helicase
VRISPNVEERTAELARIHGQYIAKSARNVGDHKRRVGDDSGNGGAPLDHDEVLRLARSAMNGAKFERLFHGDTSDYDGDESRADQALCCILAFYTRDPRTD